MYLPDFEVFEPAAIAEACELLDHYRMQGTGILAGGTDFLVDIRPKIIRHHMPRCPGCPSSGSAVREPRKAPQIVISLSRIQELRGILMEGNHIRIGTMTTIRELSESETVRIHLKALHEGACNLGSPLVRNRGTIGGNIANARPAADTFVPSVALNGKLLVRSISRSREIPLDRFATGPGISVLEPDEIITHIIFPLDPASSGSGYYKLANRKSLEIAVVSAASYVALDGGGNRVESTSIALGAVGPTPLLAHAAMEFLTGKPPEEEIIRETAFRALDDAKPISDHRGTRSYRQDQVEVLVRRTLIKAIDQAINRLKGLQS